MTDVTLLFAQSNPGDATPTPPNLPGDEAATSAASTGAGGPGAATSTVQSGSPGTSPATRTATGPAGGFDFLWIVVLLGFVLLWVFMLSGQRKEKKKRAAMLDTLKKGDRIQTVGGILGSVIEIRDNEVLVKVDENANTRLRFARSAIQNVLEDKSE